MSKTIAVSVICNTYNHEKYIRDALDGFVMQKTTFPVEVLVHDDASTDHTADIVREYEEKHPKLIKAIYQTENQYSKHDGTIRRIQTDRAHGRYVAFCEGDDYWTDTYKLQKQYDFMESHPEYTMCGCSTYWIDMATGKRLPYSIAEQDKDILFEEFLNPSNNRPFPYVSFFMRTETWRNMPKWGFPVGDLPMTYYAALNGRVRMLSDVMCEYRFGAEGSWTSRNKDDKAMRIKNHEKMIQGLEAMDRDTEYQYDGIIQRRILTYKYAIAKLNRDYRALRSGDLGERYVRRSFSHRMMDMLCCKAPVIYRLFRRIRNDTNEF